MTAHRTTISGLVFCLFTLLGSIGCTWIGMSDKEEQITPEQTVEGVWVWRHHNLADYDRVTVDPVTIETAEGIVMARDTRQQIADQLRREVVVRLANHFEVVEPGGAKVFRLHLTVHNVHPGAAMGMADAWIDVSITDSVTEQLLLTIRDLRSHAHMANVDLATEWESAREVMISWADEIRNAILQSTEE